MFWKKAEAKSNRRKNILLVFDNCIGLVNWKAPIVDEVFSTHRHLHSCFHPISKQATNTHMRGKLAGLYIQAGGKVVLKSNI